MDKKEIKALRQKLMLDQQEFADLIAVHRETVSKWERGKQQPRAVHLRQLARLQKKAKSSGGIK